tara:strand:- start:313 stop:837 length:525 start_codon:yes stop_codon:yes gene_type:complete
MDKNKKVELVENLSEKFKNSSALYFTKYTGMNVPQATELREKFKDNDVDYLVSKNTLTKLAIAKSGLDNNIFDDFLLGQIAIAYAKNDPTAPAKVIKEFSKSNDCIEVIGLYFDGEVYNPDKFKELADLPSKEELLTKLVCGLNSPMLKTAYCLKSSMTNFVNVLNNLREKKNK